MKNSQTVTLPNPATTLPNPATPQNNGRSFRESLELNIANNRPQAGIESALLANAGAQAPAQMPTPAQAMATPNLNTQTSVVDFLKSQGQASDFNTRGTLANQFGIDNYKGTADQNMQLMTKLQGSSGQGSSGDSQYSQEVSNQLGDRETDETNIQEVESPEIKMQEAFTNMENLRKQTYDSEYASRNLGEIKGQIGTLDNDIAQAKALRDSEIAKIRSNPGLSASQMSGDIKKAADFQNQVINNLIEQRNSVASQYNTELEEINTIIGQQVADAQLQYQYWSDMLNRQAQQEQLEQQMMVEQLQGQQEQERWEREMAQQLSIAQLRQSDTANNLQLVNDIIGQPQYWANRQTGEITPVTIQGLGERAPVIEAIPDNSRTPFLQRIFGSK